MVKGQSGKKKKKAGKLTIHAILCYSIWSLEVTWEADHVHINV